MKEEEFKENLEKELKELEIQLSDKQIQKLYVYMRSFIGMESKNKFDSDRRTKRSD